MITYLSLATFFVSSNRLLLPSDEDYFRFIDRAVQSSEGFVSDGIEGADHITLRRRDNRYLMSISVRDHGGIINQGAFASAAARKKNWTPSSMPIGKLNWWPQTESRRGTTVYNDGVSITGYGAREHVKVTYFPAHTNGGYSKRFLEVKEFDNVGELTLRDVLSSYASLRLDSDGSVKINGGSYPAMRAIRTEAQFIELEEWAKRNNVRLKSGHGGTVKSFSYGGQMWIIPLASMKIKKGSAWQTLPDLVMRKDGKFYVPVAAFNN